VAPRRSAIRTGRITQQYEESFVCISKLLRGSEKLRKAILLWIVLLLTACSDGNGASLNPKFSENDAIAKVITSDRSVRFSSDVSFPAEAKRVKGIIHGGGPAPGITIPGEFESSAKRVSVDTFIVTLTEYWKAKDFRDSAEKKVL
jgi:hypothetical protein